MKHKIIPFVKPSIIIGLALCLTLACVYQATAAQEQNDSLLRVEVKAKDGTEVNVSLPLSLIHTMYQVMPKEIEQICKELKLTPEIILAEFAVMEEEDLVRTTGANDIRVWIDPAKEEAEKELRFVRIKVKEGKEDGNEVNVCLPRGLVALTGRVVKQLGLVDKYVELPKELRELKIKKIEEKQE
ncbi:hypothetical protein GF373_01680 [bacterium]|nr:hypothetical protein [bacterium]